MKRLLPLLCAPVLFSGCNDVLEDVAGFSKPKLRDEQVSGKALASSDSQGNAEEWSIFPMDRTLTDRSGRKIDVTIVGKNGDYISFIKQPSKQRFDFPLSKLARTDQVLLKDFPDGGEFGAVKPVPSRAKLSNRNATWHSQIRNAEREASALGVPLLVAVMVDEQMNLPKLERHIVYSREFKAWADRNISLALVRADSGSREEVFQVWKTLAKYGIRQTERSLVTLINPQNSTVRPFQLGSVTSTKQAIDQLESSMESISRWDAIVEARPPTREASPFRVNGGARFTGGGGCSSGSS